jgi:hypothetical protein
MRERVASAIVKLQQELTCERREAQLAQREDALGHGAHPTPRSAIRCGRIAWRVTSALHARASGNAP